MELQKTQNCQSNLAEKNKAGGIPLPNFRQNCKATVVKTVVLVQKQTDGSMAQNSQPRNKPIHKGGGRGLVAVSFPTLEKEGSRVYREESRHTLPTGLLLVLWHWKAILPDPHLIVNPGTEITAKE